MSKKQRKLYSVLALAILVSATIGVFFYSYVLAPPAGSAKVRLVVRPGWKVGDIAAALAEKGVVRNSRLFIALAGYRGIGRFLPGKYDLQQGMNPSDALLVLAKGPVIEKFVVTIPEGFNIKQIAARLSEKTRTDGSEFANLAQNGAHSKDFEQFIFIDNATPSLEGYLFPKTYTVTEETTPQEFVDMMLEQFQKETAGVDFAAVGQQRGLTNHSLLTIASLIEAEAKIAEERPLISAVIYNRLNKKMKLQIDATVQYALPERKASLTSQDLKAQSPYNTYLHFGLPPGPICNPGLASIQAALNPAPVNYLYYVLTDLTGRHTFTDSYQEFLKQKQKARSNKS